MAVLTLDNLQSLAGELRQPRTVENFTARHKPAAVLMLIFPREGELQLVLTRRAKHLPEHAGQISLPGGAVNAADPGPVAAALREANEEIGLDTSRVEVLGCFEAAILPSGYAVVPVLGISREIPKLQAQPQEVDEIFAVPLHVVAELSRYRQDHYIRNGIKRNFYYIDYKGYYIWGATAVMLRSLAQALYRTGLR